MRKKGILLLLMGILGESCHVSQATVGHPGDLAKVLKVPEIEYNGEVGLREVSRLLEAQVEPQVIGTVNWEAFPYRPDVQFRIAHSNNKLWLKFHVTEDNILARRTEANTATHRDSCVEFFLDPQQNGDYYNFEFNCIGTTHLAYGSEGGKREFVPPGNIREQILIESSLGDQPFPERTGGHSWEMTMVIPAEILVHEKGIQLKGLTANANFYKCGDDTAVPHYLSWSPVGTDRPNFHQPKFFGRLIFE